MTDLLHYLASTGLALAIKESPSLFPWLEVVHVIAISTVLGSILFVDLRLLGLASTDMILSRLLHSLLPITWIAFALAAISGGLLFLSQTVAYMQNFAFRLKLLMLLLAGLNMAIFHLVTQRNLALWNSGAVAPRTARLAGALSLSIWITVAGAGRWIGFTISKF